MCNYLGSISLGVKVGDTVGITIRPGTHLGARGARSSKEQSELARLRAREPKQVTTGSGCDKLTGVG